MRVKSHRKANETSIGSRLANVLFLPRMVHLPFFPTRREEATQGR